MTDIYFVRHGESTANKDKVCAGHTDVDLTDLGQRQAEAAGDELARSSIRIDKIVSSPLKRAYKTALAIADKINYSPDDIIISDLAIERYRGHYEGQPSSAQDGATEEDYIRMGAESTNEMVDRAERLRAFIARLDTRAVLIVSHNQFGCVFVATTRKEPLEVELNKLPNAHVFKV